MFRTQDLEALAVGVLLRVVEVAEHSGVIDLGLVLRRERCFGFHLNNLKKHLQHPIQNPRGIFLLIYAKIIQEYLLLRSVLID